MSCMAIVLGSVNDPIALVRAAVCRTLGVFVLLPSFQEVLQDPQLLITLSENNQVEPILFACIGCFVHV